MIKLIETLLVSMIGGLCSAEGLDIDEIEAVTKRVVNDPKFWQIQRLADQGRKNPGERIPLGDILQGKTPM
jgi:hypothetical protein